MSAPGATDTVPVAIELGKKRVFASALDWPGWSRAGRDEEAALAALGAFRDRYAAVLPTSLRRGLPGSPSFRVEERLEGDATTDFGAPGATPAFDRAPARADEAERLAAILRACWASFAEAAGSAGELRKGPRGGGRDAAALAAHVDDADRAYLGRLGAGYRLDRSLDPEQEAARMREAFVAAVVAAFRGEPPARTLRSEPWPPAYAVRRSAWHALDHRWEIEDRSTTS